MTSAAPSTHSPTSAVATAVGGWLQLGWSAGTMVTVVNSMSVFGAGWSSSVTVNAMSKMPSEPNTFATSTCTPVASAVPSPTGLVRSHDQPTTWVSRSLEVEPSRIISASPRQNWYGPPALELGGMSLLRTSTGQVVLSRSPFSSTTVSVTS